MEEKTHTFLRNHEFEDIPSEISSNDSQFVTPTLNHTMASSRQKIHFKAKLNVLNLKHCYFSVKNSFDKKKIRTANEQHERTKMQASILTKTSIFNALLIALL